MLSASSDPTRCFFGCRSRKESASRPCLFGCHPRSSSCCHCRRESALGSYKPQRPFALAALSLLACLTLPAQEIQLGDGIPHHTPVQRVTFDPAPLVVCAAKPQWIELHFQVAPGFHVNSHEPKDETLIPTAVRLLDSPGIRLLKDEYPAGTPLRLSTGAGETLSTYANDFRVRLQIVARPGTGTVEGVLHYQACNAASCFPPRDLPFSLPLTSR